MARSTWDGAVTVHKYGVPASYDLPDQAMRQLVVAHRLRNRLVEIEHDYNARVQEAWDAHPEIAATTEAVTAAETTVAQIVERAKSERIKDRSTVARAGTKAKLAAARKTLKEAKTARKTAKARHYTALKDDLAAVRDERKQQIKGCYKRFCQDGEPLNDDQPTRLYWATYNHVVDTHATATRQVAVARKQGRPADMRFHRWDGTGTLTVQLQRQAGDPERTWDLLASGDGKWRNSARCWPTPEPAGPFPPSKRRPRWAIRLTLGRGEAFEVPFIMHRPLPAGADVTQIQVTRRTIAGRPRISIAFTCRIPAPAPAAGTIAAVHFGWRSLGPDPGDVRVATITSQTPLPRPPESVPVRAVQGAWEVYLPGRVRHRFDKPDELRAQRDQSLDVVRADLAGWLDEVGPVDHPTRDGTVLTAAVVERWRSPARFAVPAQAWRSDPPDVDRVAEIAAMLEAWRLQDKHLWSWEANERDQLVARVRDMWRNVAAWLTGQCGMVVIDSTEISRLAVVPEVGEEDTRQGRAARRQRQVGSPGELRAAIRIAANTRGVTVNTHDSRTGGAHIGCGGKLSGDPAAAVDLWCQQCGIAVDQDVNTVTGMLEAATAPVADE